MSTSIHQGDVVLLVRLGYNSSQGYDADTYNGWYVLLRDKKSMNQMYYNLDNPDLQIPTNLVTKLQDSPYDPSRIFSIKTRIHGNEAIRYMKFEINEDDLNQIKIQRRIKPIENEIKELENQLSNIQDKINQKSYEIRRILEGVKTYKYVYCKYPNSYKEYCWIVPECYGSEIIPGMKVKVRDISGRICNLKVIRIEESSYLRNNDYILGICD